MSRLGDDIEEEPMFDEILSWLHDAPPVLYFLLLTSAGLGVPVSEDLLSIWAGSVIASEPAYPAWQYALALYAGVILSDFITFSLGRLTQKGVGKRVQAAVFKDPMKVDRALARIRKHGDSIGFVQRFSIGARLPLSFLAGYTGISPWRFTAGACLGAFITLPLQLSAGYMMHGQFERVRAYIEDYGLFVALFCIGGLVLFFWSKFRTDESS